MRMQGSDQTVQGWAHTCATSPSPLRPAAALPTSVCSVDVEGHFKYDLTGWSADVDFTSQATQSAVTSKQAGVLVGDYASHPLINE